MVKSAAMMVPPPKMAANKEMAMANTDMSNGKMRSACTPLHEGPEARWPSKAAQRILVVRAALTASQRGFFLCRFLVVLFPMSNPRVSTRRACHARAAKSHPLTKSKARRIWLRRSGSIRRRRSARAPAVAEAVAHLGYVQIDTINVIERSHHHILYTRIPGLSPRAISARRRASTRCVFEYWTHALSYMPPPDFRFFLAADEAAQRKAGHWFQPVNAGRIRARS